MILWRGYLASLYGWFYTALLYGKLAVCAAIVLTVIVPATAQDTLTYEVSTLGFGASQRYLPQWGMANRFGILDGADRGGGLLRLKATATHYFSRRWSVVAGADGIARVSHSSDAWLQQGYVALRYGNLSLGAGRVEETTGSQYNPLSSGSLGISGNARPIPRIRLALAEYTDVPFTQGYFQVKGDLVHGWLGEDRYGRGAYLHQKSLYGKVGGSLPVNLYGGLTHFAIWGGKTTNVQIPNGWKDYLRVISGSSGTTLEDGTLLVGEAANAAGDHMGVYELGIETQLRNFWLQLYQQTVFEDKSGNNPFNGDRLLGVSLRSKKTTPRVARVLYEFLYTKHQSGPGLTDPLRGTDQEFDLYNYGYRYGGRDNYYNNYLYKTGWAYQGHIIGTPLFFTQEQAQRYLPGFTEPDRGGFNFNIVNNRVVVHHVGVEGYVAGASYRLLGTYTQNYGTYAGLNGGIQQWGSIENPDQPYAFDPALRQTYWRLEVVSHPFSEQWSLLTSLSWDVGQLSNNIGLMIGLSWKGRRTFAPARP